MREKLWDTYEKILFNKYYYWHYKERATSTSRNINIFIAVSTSASFVSWILWDSYPYLLASIIAIAQIVGVAKEYLHYSEQITAVNYYLPDAEKMIIEIEEDWEYVNNIAESITEQEILKLISKYEKHYIDLEHKYMQSISFPRKAKISKKAMQDKCDYLERRYQIKK